MAENFTKHNSGGRTRHVVNLVSPGNEGDLAYTFTHAAGATDAPSGATAGYKNVGLQKNLHVLIMNNNGGTFTFEIWGYHSFAGQWGRLKVIDPADGGDNVIVLTAANDDDEYNILNIEGIERVYVQCTATATGNNCTVYLGANTI